MSIPALRYEKWLGKSPAKLRESLHAEEAKDLTELEIQAHWFSGDFGTEFTTASGDSVKVVQFGAWNREAGPDFAEAAVSVNGGKAKRGSIEIDPEAQDWERHGHATNADYDDVVLHVCLRDDGRQFFTRTSRHKEVPRVRIDTAALNGAVSGGLALAKPGRCVAPLRELPPGKLDEILEASAQFRMRRKSARLARLGELHGTDEALYQELAVTLGYKANKPPFTVIAQRLPLKFLQQRGDDLEALLFGMAGFLGASDFTKYDLETRAYLRGLWDGWWKLREDFAHAVLQPGTWRINSTRPVNHPQRRLAALAQIVRHWGKLRTAVKSGEISQIADFLEGLRDPYWDFHYTLASKKAARRMALVGGTRVGDMLANVFYPLLIALHPERWREYKKLPAPVASRKVRIAATRLFGSETAGKVVMKSAANQQGLLQIYEDFCMQDDSDCAQCRFPEQLAQW